MRRLAAHLMVWLMMVGYLLATVGASWLHRHDHSPGRHQEAAHHVHVYGGHHHHAHQPRSPHFHSHDHEHLPVRIPLHDNDCFVCQFLAKTSTAASRVELDEVGDFVGDAVEHILATPDSRALGLAQSRAPPVDVS